MLHMWKSYIFSYELYFIVEISAVKSYSEMLYTFLCTLSFIFLKFTFFGFTSWFCVDVAALGLGLKTFTGTFGP
jgi:hypothetical protein